MSIARQLNAISGGNTATADALFKSIVPNIGGTYARAKKRTTLFSLLIAAGFIVMVVSIILMFTTGERSVKKGWEGHYSAFGANFGNTTISPNMAFLPFAIIGAATFVVFIVLTSKNGMRQSKLGTLNTLVNEIASQEKASLAYLSISQGFSPISKASVIRIINRLIETKNLEGYEVIDEVGVARTDAKAVPSDFNVVAAPQPVGIGARVGAAISAFTNPASDQTQQPAQPAKPRPTHCAGCGSAIKKGSGRFCEFCGTRLE